MPSQKISIDGQVKELLFTDFKDFMHQVESHLPDKTSFVIVNPETPWEEIKAVHQLSTSTTALVIPLITTVNDTKTTQQQPASDRSTLDHFLRTHEAKNEYFMNNPQYKEKLNMEIHRFIHTEKDVLLFERLVTKLEKLSAQQSFLSKNNNYYLEWILNLTTLGSELPTPLVTRIRRLNQHIVDSILYNSKND